MRIELLSRIDPAARDALLSMQVARRFVADALALRDRAPLCGGAAVWRGEAARLLAVAGSIDLAVPGVADVISVEASLHGTGGVSAGKFVGDFRDETQRLLRRADRGRRNPPPGHCPIR